MEVSIQGLGPLSRPKRDRQRWLDPGVWQGCLGEERPRLLLQGQRPPPRLPPGSTLGILLCLPAPPSSPNPLNSSHLHLAAGTYCALITKP